ncbi:hypothetical protein BSNK01_05650 [Bacillaceae bacterium]
MSWKGILAGALVLLLTFVTLTTIRPNPDRGADDGPHGTADMAQMQARNVQSPDASLMTVNYLGRIDSLKNRLNEHPSIVTINHNPRDKSHYIRNQVTVKFSVHPDEQEIAKIAREIDGKMKKNLKTVCIFESRSKPASELIRYFKRRNDVIYVEPNYILLPNRLPNDALYFDYQWNLPMIETENGWDITRGSREITIAVIDTGVDLHHPDLADRLSEGYNVLTDDDHPQDDNGHGTHVAGIIAAETNNREGVAGITWYNRIMPIKAIGADGTGTSFDIAKGIIWATDHGAKVINMSLGNYQPSSVLKEAVAYAYERDVVLVAATGNDDTDQPGYPAAYPEVLAVSAIGFDGSRAEFSNYGDYVDVVAPGVDVASTYPDEQYAALSGTSMAAPHVAALAGLIRSIHPDLKNTEVMDIIRKTAIDLGDAGKDMYYGNGVIDIENALESAYRQRYPLLNLGTWFDRFLFRAVSEGLE